MSREGGRRPARRVFFVLLALGSPLAIIAGLELFCRRVEVPVGQASTRVSTADVLEGASWAEEHRRNMAGYYARYQPRPVIRYFPYAGWVMRPFESETFNVDEDGVRRSWTSTAPGDATTDVFRVYLFGGSTMVCADVPDALTLPSQLGVALERLRGAGSVPVEVVNYGTSAYSSTQEMLRLLHEMQRGFARRGKPDLVVFYDGVNDVWAGVHLGRPGYPDAHERMALRFDDLCGFLGLKVQEALEGRSALVRALVTLRRPGGGGPGGEVSPGAGERLTSLARAQASIVAENMRVTRAWGCEFGFQVIHVLQPVIFVQEGGHAADAALQRELAASDPALAAANREGYRHLRELYAKEEGCVDLSAALDGVPAPLYVDYCHLGTSGNRRVAERLARAVHEGASGKSSSPD